MVTDDFRSILRRAGNVLIVVGVIDAGIMVACILTMTSYSSSLNVFAIIAGVMLRRGSLAAAAWVTRFAALFLGLIPVAMVLSTMEPWAGAWHANPALLALSFAFLIGVGSLAIWLLRELRRQPVLDAMKLTGMRVRPPYAIIAAAVVVCAGVGLLVHHLLDSPAAHRAVDVARAKYGTQYQYRVTRMNWTPEHATATLEAYNDHESKTVMVTFDTP
jgi:hypothetical protein